MVIWQEHVVMAYTYNRKCRLVIAAVALTVVACFAESRAEVPKPEASPDLSTAKSAALAWIDASFAGDVSIAHQVMIDDEQQRKFMAGPLRFGASLKILEQAAVKQFGDEGRQVTGYPDGSAHAMEKQLTIKEDGDQATATVGDAARPLHLRRIDGKWHVDLSDLVYDKQMQRISEASASAADVAEKLADEIAQGKLKTVDEAKAAFQERRMARYAKQPSTQPGE